MTRTGMSIDDFLLLLENVRQEKPGQWEARCPGHDDNRNSLSVGVSSDGTILLKCQAGCDTAFLLDRLGLKMCDLFQKSNSSASNGHVHTGSKNGQAAKSKSRNAKTYDYNDESGVLLFQVCRREPKDFRQRRPKEGGGWEWTTKGTRKVPYRLPELLKADKSEVVFIVEGEKDVDRLISAGQVATTNAGGAGNWKSELCPPLHGRRVVILPDNDDPGRKHAEQVAKSLKGKAASIKIVNLPGLPVKGDVSDFFDAGGTKETLLALAQDVPDLEQEAGASESVRGRSRKRKTPPPDDGDPLTPFNPEGQTDLANGRRLVRLHGDIIRYCFAWKSWLIWDGKRWCPDKTGQIERLAKDVCDAIFRAALAIDDLDTMRFAIKSASAKGIAAMISLAASEPDIPIVPDEMDRNNWLLNCENGTVDLKTGELFPARKEDLITKLCPTRFDPDAPSHTFETALEAICGCKQPILDFLRRLFGHGLTGDVSEQIVSIFHGIGSNGKTTLVEIILAVIGRDYAGKAPPELLLRKKNEAHPTERADLHGKRLVFCVETPEDRNFNETLVKELSGGDTVHARRLYENFWSFEPTHKVVICTNHRPEVAGTDHGFWRRIALVPFGVIFWDAEKGETGPPELKKDKLLKERILAEREGVLAWMVRGCLEWQRNGLVLPAEVQAATAEYRSAEDAVQSFIEECCLIAPMCREKATPLYDAYKAWSQQAGREAVKQKRFGTALTDKGFKRDKSNGVRYLGIGLLADHTMEAR